MNLSTDITSDELKVFLEEAEEQIELLDEDIVKLEKEGKNPDLLQEIFRAAHTLKGSSAVLGYDSMTELTHAMESLLDKLRSGKLSVSTDMVDALLYSLDALKVLNESLISSEDSHLDITPMVARLKEVIGESPDTTPDVPQVLNLRPDAIGKIEKAKLQGKRVCRIEVSISEESTWAAVRCLQVISEIEQIGEVAASAPSAKEIEQEKVGSKLELVFLSLEDEGKIRGIISSIDEIDEVNIFPYDLEEEGSDDKQEAAGPKKAVSETPQAANKSLKKMKGRASPGKAPAAQSIRIDVNILDSLMNMVEELVIDRSRLSRLTRLLETKYTEDELVQDLGETATHVVKVINALQENITQVRMVPIATVFNSFPRMVRDLAQKEGKKLDFIIEGRETELDRTIIEQVRDPLIHLLRNSIDHGIESPQQRKAANKPETAVLRLSSYHEQGNIVITVEDDGRGIDLNKVRSSAVKKGIISAEALRELTDAEATDLIFASGMSTLDKVTDISGRGVGLDIVKVNIEGLNGTVSLKTRVNEGTKFTIKLPLTVGVITGLAVSSGETVFIIPLSSVTETLSVKVQEIKTIKSKEVITLREKIIPVFGLSTVLSTKEKQAANNGRLSIVVVKAANKVLGIIVDSVMEQQEFVVKSMGKHLRDIKGLAGATIMGDGQVALILDVLTFIGIALKTGSSAVKHSSNATAGKILPTAILKEAK